MAGGFLDEPFTINARIPDVVRIIGTDIQISAGHNLSSVLIAIECGWHYCSILCVLRTMEPNKLVC